MHRRSGSASGGFTLVEVLIAVGLFVTMAAGVAQLIAVATRTVRDSRQQTLATILAAAKIDQLRALAWTYEPAAPGVPALARSDTTTDVSHPDLGPGGRGLSPSPSGSLEANTSAWVDYADAAGRWLGRDDAIPPDAVFVRRWSVTPLPADPERTLVLEVLVTTVLETRLRTGAWRGRSGVEAHLVSVRTRKAQ